MPAQDHLARGAPVIAGDASDHRIAQDRAAPGERTPGLGDHAGRVVDGDQARLREMRVQLDLVHLGGDPGRSDQGGQVIRFEVGHTHRAQYTLLLQLQQRLPGRHELPQVGGRPMDQEQVQIVGPHLVQGAEGGAAGGVPTLVAVPQLAGHEQLGPPNAARRQRLAQRPFVPVQRCGVEQPVPGPDGGVDHRGHLSVVDPVKAQAHRRHERAAAQGDRIRQHRCIRSADFGVRGHDAAPAGSTAGSARNTDAGIGRTDPMLGRKSMCAMMSRSMSTPGATSVRVIPRSSSSNTARSVMYRAGLPPRRAWAAANVTCPTDRTNLCSAPSRTIRSSPSPTSTCKPLPVKVPQNTTRLAPLTMSMKPPGPTVVCPSLLTLTLPRASTSPMPRMATSIMPEAKNSNCISEEKTACGYRLSPKRSPVSGNPPTGPCSMHSVMSCSRPCSISTSTAPALIP